MGDIESQNNPYDHFLELASLTDYITQYGEMALMVDIKLTDLYSYLRNPYRNVKSIRNASKYMTNKHGVVKDILKAMKSLPTLIPHLAWSSYDNVKQIKKYEKIVYDFLDQINVRKVAEHALYEIGEVGTIIYVNRKNRYMQSLDLDDVRVIKQEDGDWIVEFDLQRIKQYQTSESDVLQILESMPDEVNAKTYNLYRNKGEDYRFVRLNNAFVLNGDGNRNVPYGLPMSLGAWGSLLQKEIINRVERSNCDRITKQILILYASSLNGTDDPPPPEMVKSYFNHVKSLVMKKENKSGSKSDYAESGTAVMSLPSFFKLETLDVKNSMFTKDVYNKLDKDIFMNIGVSPAIVYGGDDANFSSATLNSEKFMRYLFTILGDIEDMINKMISKLLPKGLTCKFYFSRTTILDRDKRIGQLKDFYMNTGIFAPYAEEVLGVPYHYAVGMAQYEQEVLNLREIIKPAPSPHVQAGNGVKPETDNPTASTEQTRNNGGNNNPSPSD